MEAHPRRSNRQQAPPKGEADDVNILHEAATARGAIEGANNPEFTDKVRQEFKDIAKESLDRVLLLANDKRAQQLARKMLEMKLPEDTVATQENKQLSIENDRKAA